MRQRLELVGLGDDRSPIGESQHQVQHQEPATEKATTGHQSDPMVFCQNVGAVSAIVCSVMSSLQKLSGKMTPLRSISAGIQRFQAEAIVRAWSL
jgi:hypothetical protein